MRMVIALSSVLAMGYGGLAAAGEAESLVKTQVDAINKVGKLKLGDGMYVTGAIADGNRITYKISTDNAELLRGANSPEFAKAFSSNVCTDHTVRSMLSKGVLVEYRFSSGNATPVAIGIDAGRCGIKVGEKPALAEKDVKQMAEVISRNLPVKLDDMTTMTSVAAAGMTMTYVYSINDPSLKPGKAPEEALRKVALGVGCKDANVRMMVDGGVNVVWKYQTGQGAPIATVALNTSTCH